MLELIISWFLPHIEKASAIIPSASFFVAFASTFSSWKLSFGIRKLVALTLKRTLDTFICIIALFILIVVTYNLGALAFPSILG